jgi:membrane associated rhomboid family serine protease
LSDDASRRTFPIVTLGIILVNVLMFLYELSLGEGVQQFVEAAGVVPAEYACRCDIPPTDVGPFWVTLFTSMWLHGGLLHLGGNLVYLWIFGDNLKDAFGQVSYLAFYLASGVAAGIAQILAGPASTLPSVGASGAIAGVLAAYLVLFPTSQIRTLLVIGPFITVRRVTAVVLIGFWALIQLLDGVASIADTATTSSGGVAYWAHVGGFLFGLVATPVFSAARGRMSGAGWVAKGRRSEAGPASRSSVCRWRTT